MRISATPSVLWSQLRSLHDGGATVRVDPEPGFCLLATDPILLSHGITLEIGRVKYPDKSPVAERAIEELSLELLNLSREGGTVSDVTLALAHKHKLPNPLWWPFGARGLNSMWPANCEQLPTDSVSLVRITPFSRITYPVQSLRLVAVSAYPHQPSLSLQRWPRKLKPREKYLVVSIRVDLSCELRKF